MNVFEILVATVGPALATFYMVNRTYTLKLRAGELTQGKDDGWDSFGVFCFAVMMGVIWPLTILWAIGRRPSREERKLLQKQRLARLVAENEKWLAEQDR